MEGPVSSPSEQSELDHIRASLDTRYAGEREDDPETASSLLGIGIAFFRIRSHVPADRLGAALPAGAHLGSGRHRPGPGDALAALDRGDGPLLPV